MSESLFDMEPVTQPPEEDLSPDRRRTQQQLAAIRAGIHPLSAVTTLVLRLHPNADRQASRDDQRGLPFTCGTCVHRTILKYHDRSYAKCVQGEPAEGPYVRITHSATTDVRAWWPACTEYSAGDPALSPDAARYIPGGTP